MEKAGFVQLQTFDGIKVRQDVEKESMDVELLEGGSAEQMVTQAAVCHMPSHPAF